MKHEAKANGRPGVQPWTLVGALLLGSVLFVLLQVQLPRVAWASVLSDIAFAGALTILALGLGGRGRIFDQSRAGAAALLALALWPLASKLALAVLPPMLAASPVLQVLGYIASLGQFVLAVAAAAAIGRKGKLPPRWRWAPLWAAFIVAIVWVLRELVTPVGPSEPDLFDFVTALYLLTSTGATMFLGGAAIALASWSDRETDGPGFGRASGLGTDPRN